jgi:hypothetical protein
LGNGDTLVAMGGGPEKLQFYVNKNDLWLMIRTGESRPYPLARLDLTVPDLKDASYHVEQDLLHAVTIGRFEKDGKSLTVETAVAATEDLFWIKLVAKGGEFHGRANLRLPGQAEAPSKEPKETEPRFISSTSETQGDVQCVVRRSEEGVMTPAGAACAVRVFGGNSEFTVKPERPTLIVATTASIFENKDFRNAAIARAAALSHEDFAILRKSHEQWWSGFWEKSFVEIPDKFLEQRYYLSQYVLASASRVHDFPPGLFGWVTTVVVHGIFITRSTGSRSIHDDGVNRENETDSLRN